MCKRDNVNHIATNNALFGKKVIDFPIIFSNISKQKYSYCYRV
jgi:hypothetical protein